MPIIVVPPLVVAFLKQYRHECFSVLHHSTPHALTHTYAFFALLIVVAMHVIFLLAEESKVTQTDYQDLQPLQNC
ncbi:hypothetical protein BVZ80_00046 [Haemophilus influenzae]|nr:hypothetical protein BVZ80_00046 [Haemophilus influenzae]